MVVVTQGVALGYALAAPSGRFVVVGTYFRYFNYLTFSRFACFLKEFRGALTNSKTQKLKNS